MALRKATLMLALAISLVTVTATVASAHDSRFSFRSGHDRDWCGECGDRYDRYYGGDRTYSYRPGEYRYPWSTWSYSVPPRGSAWGYRYNRDRFDGDGRSHRYRGHQHGPHCRH